VLGTRKVQLPCIMLRTETSMNVHVFSFPTEVNALLETRQDTLLSIMQQFEAISE